MARKLVLLFLSVLREGMYWGTRAGHTPAARPGVDLVCPRLITREVEQCSKDVVPRGTVGPAWRYGQKKMSMTRERL